MTQPIRPVATAALGRAFDTAVALQTEDWEDYLVVSPPVRLLREFTFDYHESTPAVELRELLRSSERVRFLQWGAQRGGDIDGILDPFDSDYDNDNDNDNDNYRPQAA